jgi:ubiquinone/menaquinone biosynthesis C-methylase UbiE
MTERRVNYDEIAHVYDRRFALDRSPRRMEELRRLSHQLRAKRILEVGCGTAYWLAQMNPRAHELFGLDASAGMLTQAQNRGAPINPIRGYARRLPFGRSSFDLVYCVNALHHFERPQTFIQEAFRVLRSGAAIAVMGSDPHGRRDSWYVYDYFHGTYENDLGRFPRWESVSTWMAGAGFHGAALEEIERISDPKRGRHVLNDPFLQKNSCSQLALLTDEAYEAGLRRIKAALDAAESAGRTLVFHTDISIAMLVGYKD